MSPRPGAATTANLRLAPLSSFYTYALRHDLLRGTNPISRVECRRLQAYASAHPLAYEDLREQLGVINLSTPAGLRDYALLLLSLHTGRRLSELAGLRREHLIIRPSRVEITWVRCKGGKVMRDELPREGPQGVAAEALMAWVLCLYGEDSRPDPLLPAPTQAAVPATPAAGTPTPADRGGSAGHSGRPIWIGLAVRNGTFGRPLSLRAIATICDQRLGTSKVHALRHTFARGGGWRMRGPRSARFRRGSATRIWARPGAISPTSSRARIAICGGSVRSMDWRHASPWPIRARRLQAVSLSLRLSLPR